MTESYAVQYRTTFSSIWLWAAAVSWAVIVAVNIIVGLFAESGAWTLVAVLAGAAWVLVTFLLLFTRRPQQGEAAVAEPWLLLHERAPWWRRVSLRGQLRLRVTAVEQADVRAVLVTGNDPFWGTVEVRFTAAEGQEAGSLYSRLSRLRGGVSARR
jgi:hypothetical protein